MHNQLKTLLQTYIYPIGSINITQTKIQKIGLQTIENNFTMYYHRFYIYEIVMERETMTKAEAFDLLQGSRIMTVGIIESIKPRYDKTKIGKTYRSGYQLAIRTPHTIVVKGEEFPIFLSVIGKSSSWHAYHILKKTRMSISVSGIRDVTKIYKNKKEGADRLIWVILKKIPIPTMVYMGKNLYSLID